MTVTLELKPEIEAKAIQQATAKGIAVEDLLVEVIETNLNGEDEKSFDEKTPIERAREWKEWVNSHDYITAPPADDSRDSIYDERESQML